MHDRKINLSNFEFFPKKMQFSLLISKIWEFLDFRKIRNRIQHCQLLSFKFLGTGIRSLRGITFRPSITLIYQKPERAFSNSGVFAFEKEAFSTISADFFQQRADPFSVFRRLKCFRRRFRGIFSREFEAENCVNLQKWIWDFEQILSRRFEFQRILLLYWTSTTNYQCSKEPRTAYCNSKNRKKSGCFRFLNFVDNLVKFASPQKIKNAAKNGLLIFSRRRIRNSRKKWRPTKFSILRKRKRSKKCKNETADWNRNWRETWKSRKFDI
jgi:hypothetical protein